MTTPSISTPTTFDPTPGAHATTQTAPQNLFGICARVGEDFGFNPLWLRLGFASALILSPVAVIAAYFALGGVVLVSRLLFPTRKTAASADVVALPARTEPTAADDLPLAA